MGPPTNSNMESDGSTIGFRINQSVVTGLSMVTVVAGTVIGSRLCRKMLCMGGLYYAGGTMISIFGLGPVVATGLVLWIL